MKAAFVKTENTIRSILSMLPRQKKRQSLCRWTHPRTKHVYITSVLHSYITCAFLNISQGTRRRQTRYMFSKPGSLLPMCLHLCGVTSWTSPRCQNVGLDTDNLTREKITADNWIYKKKENQCPFLHPAGPSRFLKYFNFPGYSGDA